jgi:spore coat polysaccharide biosynthesis predicted glycosyltransferase SpsG
MRKGIRLERIPAQSNIIPNILLTTGGNEIADLVDKFIIALASISFEFSAEILSNRAPNFQDHRFRFGSIGSDYTEKLKTSDAVITTSGVSSVEIAANRIPMALFSAVDNQRENYSLLTTSGYATGIGEFDKNGGRVEIVALTRFLTSLTTINRLGEVLSPNLDFDGSKRIVDLILSLD